MTTAIDTNVLAALWTQVIHCLGLRGKRWDEALGRGSLVNTPGRRRGAHFRAMRRDE